MLIEPSLKPPQPPNPPPKLSKNPLSDLWVSVVRTAMTTTQGAEVGHDKAGSCCAAAGGGGGGNGNLGPFSAWGWLLAGWVFTAPLSTCVQPLDASWASTALLIRAPQSESLALIAAHENVLY